MAIFNYEYCIEASHGKLKNSFRTVADADTGHMLKIVYDLKSDDVAQIGDHTRQEDRDFKKDRDTIKNINKTGSNDFSSRGTVKAIIDLDTGKRLNSAKGVGVIGSNSDSRFQIPSQYVTKGKQDYSFSNYSKENREKIAADPINSNVKNSKDALTYTVGEKEKTPTYKSTIATKSTKELYDNEWNKKARGYSDKRLNDEKNISSTVEDLKKDYNSIKDMVEKSGNDDLIDDANYFENRLKRLSSQVEENKNEKYGQSSGDGKYKNKVTSLKNDLSDIKYDLNHLKSNK